MSHYQRNIRFILFLILPILGFLLGWSLSQKHNQELSAPLSGIKVETSKTDESIESILKIKIPIRRKSDPKKVDLSIFWEAWNTVEANFLYQEKFKTQEQVYGATRGLIRSLGDPYTVFMSPDETKEFEESISGEFEGIGAEIAIKNEQLVVVSPLKGSPAQLAGLRSGDAIFKINGELTFGMSISQAVTKIRGPKGEKVVLTVIRNGEYNPIDITVVRDHIVVKSLEWEMRDDVAILEISQFGTELVKEFNEAMPEILLMTPRGIIIDLRNNGGGLLDAAIKIMSEFFDKKVITKTKGRQFGQSGDLMSGTGGAFLEVPLIVLINRGSASASEIFVGAVQDYKRGVVLGEKTFGKGSVQNVIPLSGGSSLKVTIAAWLTPKGRSINDIGIEPDEVIKMTREDFDNDNDPVLDRGMELIGTEEMEEMLAEEEEGEEGEEVDEVKKDLEQE